MSQPKKPSISPGFYTLGAICIVVLILGLIIIANNSPEGTFVGDVIVPLEGPSGIAVAGAGVNTNLAPLAEAHRVYSNITHERLGPLLPIQSRDKLDPDVRYDAIAMPFELELESIYTDEQDIATQVLSVKHLGEVSSAEIAVGEAVRLGLEAFRLEEVRRWTGLYPHANGLALAQIAINPSEDVWLENIILSDERWNYFEPDAAAKLVWCDSAEDAGQRSAEELPETFGARWTLTEGDSVHVFDGIAIGMGIEAQDGTEYTLVDFREATEEQPAAIAVSIVNDGGESVTVVEANDTSDDGAIQFELPSARARAFRVYAWIDQGGTSCIVRDLDSEENTGGLQGEPIPVSRKDYRIRLDQALPTAVPVAAEDSTVSEAVLTNGHTTLRLRHAEPVTYGDYVLEFRRTIARSETDLLLIAHHRDAASVTTFRLPVDSQMRIMGWNLSLIPNPAPNLDVFLVRAEYDPGLPLYAWIGAGMVLVGGVILAAVILLAQRVQEAAAREETL